MSEEQKDLGRQQGLDKSVAGVAGMRLVQGDQNKSFDGAANLKPAAAAPAAQVPTPAVTPAAQPSEAQPAAPAEQSGGAGS